MEKLTLAQLVRKFSEHLLPTLDPIPGPTQTTSFKASFDIFLLPMRTYSGGPSRVSSYSFLYVFLSFLECEL